MKYLVFFLEELSAKAFLEGLLPKLLPSYVHPEYIVFEGKQDLKSRLPKKLKAWNKPDCAFVALLDQDHEDCQSVKQELLKSCRQAAAGKALIVRIACHELESWYFGGLNDVGRALGADLSRYQNKKKYRKPDDIQNPAKELARITKGAYQKISGSRAVGPKLSIEGNSSPSFQAFIKGLERLLPGL